MPCATRSATNVDGLSVRYRRSCSRLKMASPHQQVHGGRQTQPLSLSVDGRGILQVGRRVARWGTCRGRDRTAESRAGDRFRRSGRLGQGKFPPVAIAGSQGCAVQREWIARKDSS